MSILEELKNQTRSEHDSIESTLNLLDPSMDEERYKKLLRGFYGFYQTAESYLRDHSGFYSQEKEKLESLRKDLIFFNINPESVEPISLEKIPHQRSEDVLGLLYVIEGSTLGGQVLCQHFHKKFGLKQGEGLNFFSGYGSQTMNNWKKTKAHIEEMVSSHKLNKGDLIQAAKDSFNSLEKWLGKSI